LISRIQLFLAEKSILDIHNLIATSNNDQFWFSDNAFLISWMWLLLVRKPF